MATWTAEPAGVVLVRVVSNLPLAVRRRLAVLGGERIVYVTTSDRQRLVTFRQHCIELDAEMDAIAALYRRVCSVGIAPAWGWPAGTVLAAADRALASLDQCDLAAVADAATALLERLDAA
jgi:hypothetical protein